MALHYNFLMETADNPGRPGTDRLPVVASGLFAYLSSVADDRFEIGTNVFGSHLYDPAVIEPSYVWDYQLIGTIALKTVADRMLYDDIGYIIGLNASTHPGLKSVGWLILTDIARGKSDLAETISQHLVNGLAYSNAKLLNLHSVRLLPRPLWERVDPARCMTYFTNALLGTGVTSQFAYRHQIKQGA
jgi:hypothetical protein